LAQASFERTGETEMMFDIWGDHDGRITARLVEKEFVSDDDAPYGYYMHLWRTEAKHAGEASRMYRKTVSEPIKELK